MVGFRVVISFVTQKVDILWWVFGAFVKVRKATVSFVSVYPSARNNSTSTERIFIKRRNENQLGATPWFIALIICSICFGHLYAHHQELETILVLLPHMVCNALVAGGRLLGAEQQAMRPG